MKKQKRLKPVEIDSKFGLLTVISIYKTVHVLCRCVCGQVVHTYKDILQQQIKTCCAQCEENNATNNFKEGDVVIVKRSNYIEPLHQQAIVIGRMERDKTIWLEVKFRGKKYYQRPSQVERVGQNFYVQCRRNTRKRKTESGLAAVR